MRIIEIDGKQGGPKKKKFSLVESELRWKTVQILSIPFSRYIRALPTIFSDLFPLGPDFPFTFLSLYSPWEKVPSIRPPFKWWPSLSQKDHLATWRSGKRADESGFLFGWLLRAKREENPQKPENVGRRKGFSLSVEDHLSVCPFFGAKAAPSFFNVGKRGRCSFFFNIFFSRYCNVRSKEETSSFWAIGEKTTQRTLHHFPLETKILFFCHLSFSLSEKRGWRLWICLLSF